MKSLKENEYIEVNPFRNVKRIQVRGRTSFQRRALTLAEVAKLLQVVEKKPTRRVSYITAIYTGLRRSELAALEWGDVSMDTDSPYIAVRASTTKSGKDANIPLHPALLETFLELKPENAKATDKVLSIPDIETYKVDLKKAGIPYNDDRGYRAIYYTHNFAYLIGAHIFCFLVSLS